LGESYLELSTGSAQQAALDPKLPLRGVDAPRLDVVANQLSKFLESASRVLEDDPRALSKLVSGVSNLSQTVDGVLTENRGDIHSLTAELTAAAKDLRALSELARTDMEPGGKGARLLDDAAASAQT